MVAEPVALQQAVVRTAAQSATGWPTATILSRRGSADWYSMTEHLEDPATWVEGRAGNRFGTGATGPEVGLAQPALATVLRTGSGSGSATGRPERPTAAHHLDLGL